jgi:hypothetical protein
LHPENAAEFAETVKEWPELHALAKDLHAKGLLPGLRNVQITLTGAPEVVAQGLGAVRAQNAASGPDNRAGGGS